MYTQVQYTGYIYKLIPGYKCNLQLTRCCSLAYTLLEPEYNV